jgi:hypothetical protein
MTGRWPADYASDDGAIAISLNPGPGFIFRP